MSEEPKLLPCPFCGGEPVWAINQVFCGTCEVGSSPNHTLNEAIAVWNRRTLIAPTVKPTQEAFGL